MITPRGEHKASIRRMMMALDAMNCESPLIEAAALIAVKLGADLDALFVEDPDVHAVAVLPFTREISRSSAEPREISGDRVEQALRALSCEAQARFSAVTRRNRIRGNFEVARAHRNEALFEALGRTPLLLLQPAQGTLLRIRVESARTPQVFAICADTPASARTLELAAHLARQDHHVLELVTAGDIDASLLSTIEQHGIRLNRHSMVAGAGIVELLQQVENRLGNTLLIAGDLAAGIDRGRLLEALSRMRCPVLLVN